jgi:hypothetical protein
MKGQGGRLGQDMNLNNPPSHVNANRYDDYSAEDYKQEKKPV